MSTQSNVLEGSLIQIRLQPNKVWQDAWHFEVDIDRSVITFQDRNRVTLSEHYFPIHGYASHFPFLSRVGDALRYDTKYNVTSLIHLRIESPNSDRKRNEHPIYSFKDWTAYKSFLEALRALEHDSSEQGVSFQRDFSCGAVKPFEQRQHNTYDTCDNVCVKVWHHADRAPTISVPLLKNGSVGVYELSASKFELYRPLSKNKVEISLSQAAKSKTLTAHRKATANTTTRRGGLLNRLRGKTTANIAGDESYHGPSFQMPDYGSISGMHKIVLELVDNDDRERLISLLQASCRAPALEHSPPTSSLRIRAAPTSQIALQANPDTISQASQGTVPSTHAPSLPSPVNNDPEYARMPSRQNTFNSDVYSRQANGHESDEIEASGVSQVDRPGVTASDTPRAADLPTSSYFTHVNADPGAAGGGSHSNYALSQNPAHSAYAGVLESWPGQISTNHSGTFYQHPPAQWQDHFNPRYPQRPDYWPAGAAGPSNHASLSSRQIEQPVDQWQTMQQIDANWKRQTKIQPPQDDARRRAHGNARFYTSANLPLGDCVRILTINRGSRADPLILTFAVVDLHKAKNTYEALSYNWDSRAEDSRVSLNGEPDFLISVHLEEGLRRIRLAQEDRKVWIDAICIDQISLKEMNHQVGLMGDIYSHARRTIIWYHVLNSNWPCEILPYTASGDEVGRKTLCANQDSADGHGLNHSFHHNMQDVLDRLKTNASYNIWHSRLWCVQEFFFSHLPPTVYVGSHAIDWVLFVQLFPHVYGHETVLSLFSELHKRKMLNLRRPTLHELCTTTGSLKVDNPRDRIFSLIHMSQGRSNMSKMKTVYEKSVVQVGEDALLYMIEESKSLDVMMDRRADRTEGPSFGPGIMPTFLPDFTQLIPLAEVRSEGRLNYCSGRNTGAQAKFQDDPVQHPVLQQRQDANLVAPRLLQIKARYFGKIERCTKIKDQEDLRHETSPSTHLIYSNFQKPGRLVEYILKTLDFFIEPNMVDEKGNFQPQIGRLILEYLLNEKRDPVRERQRCSGIQQGNLQAMMQTELERDKRFAAHKASAALAEEYEFIDEHWKVRAAYIVSMPNNTSKKFDLQKMISFKDSKRPWSQVAINSTHSRPANPELYNDMQAALEYENLFCLARRTEKVYYMFDGSCQQYYRPMRSDVLECEGQFQNLPSQHDPADRDEGIEWHPYSKKAREREFFKTSDGFIGLGPAVMQAGDIIVVAYGASRPLILRPCDHMGDGSFTFVGEAILPAVMHVEWLENPLGQDRWFALR